MPPSPGGLPGSAPGATIWIHELQSLARALLTSAGTPRCADRLFSTTRPFPSTDVFSILPGGMKSSTPLCCEFSRFPHSPLRPTLRSLASASAPVKGWIRCRSPEVPAVTAAPWPNRSLFLLIMKAGGVALSPRRWAPPPIRSAALRPVRRSAPCRSRSRSSIPNSKADPAPPPGWITTKGNEEDALA